MEAMQDVYENRTRDSDLMDLDVEEMKEGRAMRTMSIRTKGLFNFMELPPEVRVQVRGSP